MNVLTLLFLIGTYCGSNKPYISDISITFYNEHYIKNNTLLDITVKLPLDKITCKKQLYNITTTGEISIVSDCVEKQLNKHHVELYEVFYNEMEDDIVLKTNAGDMTLPLCE